jgi:hypothetical protein
MHQASMYSDRVASQERCKWLWAQVLGEVRRRL